MAQLYYRASTAREPVAEVYGQWWPSSAQDRFSTALETTTVGSRSAPVASLSQAANNHHTDKDKDAREFFGVLWGLWRKDLAALRGACPNCGEEVFAFVRSDQSGSSPHRADCHVCECLLEFRTKIEQPVSILGRRWVHGRVYLVRRRRTQSQRWI